MTLSAEAALLHAVIDEDLDEARRRIRDMLPGEQRSLLNSLHTMANLLNEAIRLNNVRARGVCGRWQRRLGPACSHPLIGYILRGDWPVGVCGVCKPQLEEVGINLLKFPEVKL